MAIIIIMVSLIVIGLTQIFVITTLIYDLNHYQEENESLEKELNKLKAKHQDIDQ